jgi:hypothetical protein
MKRSDACLSIAISLVDQWVSRSVLPIRTGENRLRKYRPERHVLSRAIDVSHESRYRLR